MNNAEDFLNTHFPSPSHSSSPPPVPQTSSTPEKRYILAPKDFAGIDKGKVLFCKVYNKFQKACRSFDPKPSAQHSGGLFVDEFVPVKRVEGSVKVYQDKLDAYWLEITDSFGFKQDVAVTRKELYEIKNVIGKYLNSL